MIRIGILGFGEAGSASAAALARSGAVVSSHDQRWDELDAAHLAGLADENQCDESEITGQRGGTGLLEHAAAIENVVEILAVDGVDVFFIGPSDLSQSMGYPGNPKAEPVAGASEFLRGGRGK